MLKKPRFITEYQFFQALTELPFIEKILLFGSRARGDAEERSDIDLAIVCPDATKRDWFTVQDIIDSADTLLKIDCIRLDTLPDSELRKEIEKNHRALFTRNNHG